ncbi:MAG: hypothetical protein A2249_04175 [Candidatus Jacksonbacteria bacterium RIFOXYA2_FULL_44_7]|uniref:PAS domain-containing protein n=1 Tax=Candidatus Jacksonbacteria bacterium RIFCSPLOWO2_02_FULL_44_20 TaxID=1798460 RepID=A0A1G2A730_9BACT|nr:MAG: hypothetical protein UW39_C0027G0014 [Parcubacteria group bacterium GW2011_GWC2_44_17]KKT50028.1 MAG: hypothetical protein UW40_C0011G0014 [Parcubacteria group bacterium GW2011_GWF2_44_17]OGY69399.1 MAG: hypothetical protein A3C00_04160 [Candidatus Jacksonbacteria bacterium RIFCSPHIGHO2_02_FULL_44_25]OGY72479.1 MAG: hypothetical protein A3H61_01065 [Candidatus Jacksonbacteria bacterium RIFCSPLOWO2_02_FULL_44_20]OGY73177.1 MAG: hypothetical protein A3H07_03315 [Candidatus Jacksonbacteria
MENTSSDIAQDSQKFLYAIFLQCLNKTSVKTLADYLAKTFADIANAQEAAIFLRRGDVYTIQGSYSLRKAKIDASHVGYKSPFVRRLKQIDKDVISKYQGDFSVDEFKVMFMKHTLSRFEIDYVIILGGKKFIGFVVLGKTSGKLLHETEEQLAQLAHQAYASIDYHILRDIYQAAVSELKEMREMHNHIMKEFPYGIIFIEQGAEKISLINQNARAAFNLGKDSVLGKSVSELLASYADSVFSDFLRAYKSAKALRRSFRSGLFDKHALRVKGSVFEISSVFISGAGSEKRGDFITVKSISTQESV